MIPTLFAALFFAAAFNAAPAPPEEARIPGALEFGQAGGSGGAKDNVVLMPETIGQEAAAAPRTMSCSCPRPSA